MASLGQHDPRLQQNGKLDLRLHRQLQQYTKCDPPPTRVKPIPIQIIQTAITQCQRTHLPAAATIAHMLTLGFFFLLRPGEYAHTTNPDAAPFRICDIHLILHNRRLNPFICTEQELDGTTYVGLEFTTQKNGVRGEIVGLGRSGHPSFCPVLTLIQRLKHFRLHHAHPHTPIYSYYSGSTWLVITTSILTQHLRWAAASLAHSTGVRPTDISIRSLRSSGAMALLCAEVDSDRIRLLGRWRSDEMLRYLHVQAFPITAPLAPLMVRHGYFTLLPNSPMG
jgi:hypothetical protein